MDSDIYLLSLVCFGETKVNLVIRDAMKSLFQAYYDSGGCAVMLDINDNMFVSCLVSVNLKTL